MLQSDANNLNSLDMLFGFLGVDTFLWNVTVTKLLCLNCRNADSARHTTEDGISKR
jgi:hypothetical protein